MKQFIKTAKALSDPNRVRILKLLDQKDLCVCELHALFDLAQSTISKHLKILEEAELATSTRQGAWIVYSLDHNSNPLNQQALFLLHNNLNDDEVLNEMISRIPFITRLPNTAVKGD